VILITGANGNLGRRLLQMFTLRGSPVRAVVRSGRARAQIDQLELDPAPQVIELDYLDEAAMLEAMQGCTTIIHLVGIIKETVASRYQDAHEGTTGVVASLAQRAGIERVIYLSIVGTRLDSANECLASKARGEKTLRQAPVPALILRVPMVLGEGDYASAALRKRAGRSFNLLLRAGSLEQPIYAGDVAAAVVAAVESPTPLAQDLDLAGPRSLTRAELTHAAAAALGRNTKVLSLPLAVGLLAAGLLELVTKNPPVTRTMLGVLDHDDSLDPEPAARQLGITLTSLEQTLQQCLRVI
jgi:NADH dehydrogenase